jgi:hypothetical protein
MQNIFRVFWKALILIVATLSIGLLYRSEIGQWAINAPRLVSVPSSGAVPEQGAPEIGTPPAQPASPVGSASVQDYAGRSPNARLKALQQDLRSESKQLTSVRTQLGDSVRSKAALAMTSQILADSIERTKDRIEILLDIDRDLAIEAARLAANTPGGLMRSQNRSSDRSENESRAPLPALGIPAATPIPPLDWSFIVGALGLCCTFVVMLYGDNLSSRFFRRKAQGAPAEPDGGLQGTPPG